MYVQISCFLFSCKYTHSVMPVFTATTVFLVLLMQLLSNLPIGNILQEVLNTK